MNRRVSAWLTVDAGNTCIGFGLVLGRRVRTVAVVETPPRLERGSWRNILRRLPAAFHGRTWRGVAGASVVPRLTPALRRFLRHWTGAPVRFVAPERFTGLVNTYRPRCAVGSDRLVGARAAAAEFGMPVIIVDLGTAVTVDAVDARGRYRGGAILPGLRLAGRALARETALLPEAELDGPINALGGTTQASLRAGLLLGAAGAVSRLVREQRRRLGSRTPVVATGGHAARIARWVPEIGAVRPALTHEGLRLWAGDVFSGGNET